MTEPRVVSEDLGGSPLARAAQRGALPQWYRPRPASVAAWRQYVQDVARQHAGGAWLRDLTPAIEPGALAAARLRRTAEGPGVVVSTGQQAALFGGPLYALVKALSALAVADAIERETGVAAAPLFWAATDDADFAEACCAKVVVHNEVHVLRLVPPRRADLPMSAVPLGDVTTLVAGLADACGSVVYDEPLEAIRSSHAPGTTLGAAYVRLLRALLEPLGIAVLDASHAAVRAAGAPLLRRALERAPSVDAALRERASAIAAAGFEPQVALVAGLSLVFDAEPDQPKRRLRLEEAADAARHRPDVDLAANVLLRPLVERTILPSAVYVAGPGEIAYFAQVSAVGGELDVPTPLVLPRWSMTIVEPRVERILLRLGLRREELEQPHAVETQLARGALPPAIRSALEALRRDVESDVDGVVRADGEQLIPAPSLEGLRQSLLHRIDRAERRYVAAIKRRETRLLSDVAALRASLYPEGKRQERVLNFIPFLARNGQPLLESLRAEAARHAATLVGSAGSAREVGGAVIAERV